MKSPLILQPTTTQLLQAQLFANVYNERGYGCNVLKVSHQQFIHFIRIGKLCEIVFIDYLRSLEIEIVADDLLIPHAGNHKKGADFIIEKTQQEVDVKAANKVFHKRILIREDQFQAHRHDIYIGAKYLSNESISFHGYLTGNQLINIEPKDFGYGLCRFMMLDHLRPVEEFIQNCIVGKAIY